MNELNFKNMINRYNELAYTHEYIFGFIDCHCVYMIEATSEMLPYILKMDRQASKRGGGYSLRFKPNRSQKELLKQNGFTVICSEEYFKETVKTSKYNKGEIFEKMVTEHFGQTWFKDSVPFTEDGDLTVNGIAYQIKFANATFCTEKSLENLSK